MAIRLHELKIAKDYADSVHFIEKADAERDEYYASMAESMARQLKVEADIPQTERPSDDDETIQAIYHLQKVGWLQEHDRILTDTPQTEDLQDWKDRMWAEAVIEPQTDCAWK